MLIIHLTIALTSLITSALALFSPAKSRFYLNYVFVGLTLLSGTVLVVQTHAPLLSSCETGLVFLSISLVLSVIAHRRLAYEAVSHD